MEELTNNQIKTFHKLLDKMTIEQLRSAKCNVENRIELKESAEHYRKSLLKQPK